MIISGSSTFATAVSMMKGAASSGSDSSAPTPQSAQKTDAVQSFLDYAKKTPAERLHEKMLKAMGMTQEQYDALPPGQRGDVDKKIADLLKEQAKAQAVTGTTIDVTA